MTALIQSAAGQTQAPPLTLTLGSPTSAGSSLIALLGDVAVSANGTPSGITLGGSAGNWAQIGLQGGSTDHAVAAAWADFGCAAGQSTVVISTAGGSGTENLFGWVFEFSGLPGGLDQSSGGANGFSGTWDSGATAATAQASEAWFGIMAGTSSTTPPGLAGPASPWVNQAQQVSGSWAAICGYQIATSTGTADYAGTASPASTADILVVTVKATAAAAPAVMYSMRSFP